MDFVFERYSSSLIPPTPSQTPQTPKNTPPKKPPKKNPKKKPWGLPPQTNSFYFFPSEAPLSPDLGFSDVGLPSFPTRYDVLIFPSPPVAKGEIYLFSQHRSLVLPFSLVASLLNFTPCFRLSSLRVQLLSAPFFPGDTTGASFFSDIDHAGPTPFSFFLCQTNGSKSSFSPLSDLIGIYFVRVVNGAFNTFFFALSPIYKSAFPFIFFD